MNINKNDFTTFSVQDSNYLFSTGTSKYFRISDCAKSLLDKYRSNQTVNYDTALSVTQFSPSELATTQTQLAELISRGYFFTTPSIKPDSDTHYADITLKLIPTKRCNLSCSYCFAREKTVESDMDLEKAKTAIDFFLNHFYTPDTRIIIDLSGAGEPLLCLDFIIELNKHITYLKRRFRYNIFIQFATNGTLLTKKVSDLLKAENILFGVSLDGATAADNASRKGLDIHQVSRNIQLIEDKEYFGVAATFSSLNSAVGEIYSGLKTFHVPAISVKPGRISPEVNGAITVENVKTIMDSFSDFSISLLEKTLSGDFSDILAITRGDDYFGKFLKTLRRSTRVYYRCSAGLNSLCIDGKGNILICPAFAEHPEFMLGNIETGITNEALYKLLLDNYADNNEDCCQCWARYTCGGECFAVSLNLHGILTKPDPAMCSLKKHLIQLSIHFWMELASKQSNHFKNLMRIMNNA